MKKDTTITDFGKRIADLRKMRGLTQHQLGKAIGVSKRVIAYYEGETKYPPAHLIVPLAQALNVSTDELLGVKDVTPIVAPQCAALWRKLKILEDFPEKDRKAVLHYVDALAAKNKAERKSANN
ncbi:MAG: helix-turn-helix transcriptional regulator [Candidatus Margulisiibacteriota bacterium]